MSRILIFNPLKFNAIDLKTRDQLESLDANKLEQLYEIVEEERIYRDDLIVKRQKEAEEAEKEERKRLLKEIIDKDWSLFTIDQENENIGVLSACNGIAYNLFINTIVKIERKDVEKYYSDIIGTKNIKNLTSFPSAYFELFSIIRHFSKQLTTGEANVPGGLISQKGSRRWWRHLKHPEFNHWFCKVIKERTPFKIIINTTLSQ